MADNRTVSVTLTAKVNAFKADVAAAGKAASDAAKQTETAWDKSNSKLGQTMKTVTQYKDQMTTVGTSMAAFGGAVVGALGLSAKAAMSWESAFAGVLKTVDGTPRQLAKVEEGLRGLTKVLPASHEEIAAVAEAAGQLGIKTGNVVSFTKTMIDMGESTNLSAEDAATSLSRLANIMGTSQKDFGKMGASIVGLGNNFATTEREIVEMSMRIAGVGKQAGLTEGDVFGLATALSSVGIDAEAGGTAISMVMKKIGNEVAGGGDKVAEFARIAGMSSAEFSAAWNADAGGALDMFVQGLGKAQESGENVNGTLTTLGITGIRESDALLRLSGAGDVLTEALKQGNDEYERGTALAEEAAKRYETAESKIKIAGNSLKDTAITIGGTFLPAIADAAEAFSNFVDGLGKIPEPVLKVGVALTGIVGAAALAGGAALILIPKIAETATAFATLRTAAANSTGFVGKVGKNLGRIQGVAKGAALGLAAVALAAEPLTKWGDSAVTATGETADALQKLSGQIAQSKIDSATLNQAFTDIVAPTDELGEFGNAVKEVINPNGWGVLSDVATDTARVLTLGMVDMTSSTEEARARFEQLGEQIATMDTEQASAAFNQMVAETDGSKESIANLIDLMPAYKDQLVDTANALGMNTDDATLAKIATEGLGSTAEGAAGAVGSVGDAASSAADGLQEMLDGLVSLGLATLSERDSMRAYEEAIDGISESIKENGTSLDITTEKGRNNQAAFDDLAKSGLDAADAMVENGASQKDVQNQLQRTYDDLIDAAGQFGITGKKAEDMAKEVMGIPKDVDIKTWMSDAAKKQAVDLKAELDKIKDKTVWVKINETYVRQFKETGDGSDRKYKTSRHGSTFEAAGSIMEFYAGGGLRPMDPVAKMVHPNTWRVVGDRSDVDEAYIPLDGSRRSMSILGEAIKRMPGLDLMANGGVVSAQNRVDSANDSLRSARRAKQDAKSAKAKAAATRRVRNAEDELTAAKKSLKAAKAKASADEKAAKLAAKQAKEAKEAAAKKRKEEAERKARVNELRTDLRTDVRRGTIRDSVTSGLSGGLSQVDELFSLGGNKDLSRASRSRANSSARKFEANLTKLYKQAERIDEKLKKAQDKASELQGISDSVSSSLLGGRDLDVGTTSTMVNGKWVTSSNLGQAAKSLRMDVGAMKAFAGKLKKLVELGVPGAIVQEIAQAGVAEGSNMADSFLDASAAERKSYVGAWSDYAKYAGQAAQFVTEGFYSGGLNAANGVVKGLESQQSNVEKAIANLAKSMEATFKSVLGIHSPSRVMAELGGFTAEGLVQGMLGGVTDVESAASALGAAAVPTVGVSVDVGAAPVAESDEGVAGLAMQDMSNTTLEAMQLMGLAVSDGFAGMLANTQEMQAGMLLATQESNFGQLTDTQTQQAAMLLNTQTQNAAMLLDTQTQQEAMRANVLAKQTGQRTAATEQQELMRLMLIDKQSQMKSKSATDFEELKNTTGTKFSDMRKNTDSTMSGMYKDYDTRLVDLKALNKSGFESLLKTSNTNMEGIKDGIDGKMGEAKPVLGNRLNALISVLSSFTASVNKAFGDVGVKLDAPKSLKFATGGVMPGYTPGRDVHQFHSPTAGDLHLSGGEAIMRPEWTRAMGGEAGVKAQNDAARQGRLDDLLHAQSQAFASGGVFGRVPGVNAFADAGVWRNLWAITRDQFPNARLTSAYRGGSMTVSGNRSYHSRGMAIDVSPSMDIFNFWRNKYGANLAELIYSPANGKQIKNGNNHYYTGAVRGMHFNHVHIAAARALSDAMAGGLPGMGGEMSHPFLDRAGVKPGDNLAKSYAQAAQKLTAQIYSKHSKDLPDGIAGQLGKGIMSQVSEGLIGKAKEYGKTTAVSGTTAGDPAVKAAVRKVAEQMGWGKYWGDIDWLVNKESSWNPNAANPSSSARGLFQKMTSLHGPVEDTVEGQARWGLNYIKSTYGNPAKARAHHQRSNWYEGGSDRAKRGLAVVGEQGPELVNFRGGEQVMSTTDSMKFMAANRTYIPNNAPAFDTSTLASSIATAVKGMQVTPEQIATAFDGVPLQLVMKDGTQMDAYMKKQIGQVAVGAGRAH